MAAKIALFLMFTAVFADESAIECFDSCGKWCFTNNYTDGICVQPYTACASYDYDWMFCTFAPALLYVLKIAGCIVGVLFIIGCIVASVEICREKKKNYEKSKKTSESSSDVDIVMIPMGSGHGHADSESDSSDD